MHEDACNHENTLVMSLQFQATRFQIVHTCGMVTLAVLLHVFLPHPTHQRLLRRVLKEGQSS